MAKRFLGFCSLLMAALFGLSASFQLNDPDWYFWFPLYGTACIVNLVNGVKTKPSLRKLAKFALWLGVFLIIKVAIEDFLHGMAGLFALEMRERIVREMFGSGLVISSMLLQLEAASSVDHRSKHQKTRVSKSVQLGMPILVGISYGLSFIFFVFQHEEMRF